MKLFRCDNCGNALYFENGGCARCGRQLGYLPETNSLLSLTNDNGAWVPDRHPGSIVHYCANAVHSACNWLVQDLDRHNGFCRACAHNETIPDLSIPGNLVNWRVIERAKKRLFYSLLRFGLPLQTRAENPQGGLAFRFLADTEANGNVMTGHDSGLVTLALVEADDAAREARRAAMGEPYRTLLGHFRHELAHYYWDVLVAGDPAALSACRAVFGDETADYDQALERHYSQGAPADWPERFVSSYATAHPWEDFAETWAHYFHIVDTLETASAFGVSIAPKTDHAGAMAAAIDFDSYRRHDIGGLLDHWVPLTLMLNNLNRSVGLGDAYPFVLTVAIAQKLDFIDRLVHRAL